MNGEETNEQRYESMGIDKVRRLVSTNGLPPQMMFSATNWVAGHDRIDRLREQERQLRNDALRIFESARSFRIEIATYIAAVAAIVAAIAAIIPMVVAK
jgi:hypothetical protein